MRVLITGSNGLLGTKLLDLLLEEPGVQVMGASRSPCSNVYLGSFPFWQVDLVKPRDVAQAFAEAAPDLVVHTAAMTDVDGCEREPARAWRENVDATQHVAAAAQRAGARLVHLSTEYVFDGTSGPYAEDDEPKPLGTYARTKLASEAIVQLAPGTVVARTTVLFGYAPNARPNFVTDLVDRLRRGESARVVTDQVGSPTLADNLAAMVWALGRDPEGVGIFHTAGATVIDRFSFARLVAETFGLDPDVIQPTDTLSLQQLARRPLHAGLRMGKFANRYPGVPVLTAEEALRRLRSQMPGPVTASPAHGSRE